ncbi:MAG: Coenzyme F420 hydrogenase/dehydrogenase, beta subunit C-terminal domain [Spirochaetota bacterium]|nr:Coenzyme F420 hydrogenase/dehydrogenase, beta subunit C-terminal domain [Spirochaetota bacterium]
MAQSISKQSQLIDNVINKNICVKCGACVGLCPYFDYFDGKVVVMDKCNSDTGRCLEFCPRSDYIDIPQGQSKICKENQSEIGSYISIFKARACNSDIVDKAQYGGVVSSLIIHALNKGIIDSALLINKGNNLSPKTRIVTNSSEVLNCAGSRYTSSAGLGELNRAITKGERNIGFVGLPCQMEALARMDSVNQDDEEMIKGINLRIGLFCTWALDYRTFNKYIKSIGIKEPIIKYDIPPPPANVFKLLTENGWQELPLDDVKPFIQKGCSLCEDMTAQLADISIGMFEGDEEWNTVIIRNDKGSQFINEAIEIGVITTEILPKESENHLKEASRNKREKGIIATNEMRPQTE